MAIHAFAQRAAGEALVPTMLDEPAAPAGHDVDVDVLHCSICRSDVHLLDGDWGDVARPLVPGHEIVGRVARAGDRATHTEGTLVGIGWQAGSCGACKACRTGRAHLCTDGKVRTCVGRQGGFATRVRVDGRFCFTLPPELDPKTAAPLLCAGVTVFSPLERLGVGPGMRVGVLGVGGLGHLAVRFASAMGAEVIGFDRDLAKRALARELGAVDLLDSRGDLPRAALDLLLVTSHAPLVWDDWMRVLDLEGTVCVIGAVAEKLQVGFEPLMDEQKKITGSVIGSPDTVKRMLAFAAAHGVAPIVERMGLASVNEAIARVREGNARMRIVLDVG